MKNIFKIALTAIISVLCIGCYIRANGDGATVTEIYTVKPGDTLWSIALEHKPEEMDTRQYMRMLKKANPGLTPDIMPGDALEVIIWEGQK